MKTIVTGAVVLITAAIVCVLNIPIQSNVLKAFDLKLDSTIQQITHNDADATHALVSKTFMDCGTKGEIGDKLFNLASMLGIASLTNHVPVIHSASLRKVFFFPHRDIHPLEHTRSVGDCEGNVGFYCFDPSSLASTHNYTISGYRQSFKYFQHIQHQIRSTFRQFTNIIQTEVRNLFTKYAESGRPLVGVHVRQGMLHPNINAFSLDKS